MSISVVAHHDEKELLACSRAASCGRIALRFLAIRDLLLGTPRAEVRKRYGISHDTLWRWVRRYNARGAAGLEDAPRSGRPVKLADAASFKERIASQPDFRKDGTVRWRAVDIRRVLREEYGTDYHSLSGVRSLCHRLGLSCLTARPRHPGRDEAQIEAFKKSPQNP